jgi:heptosyltransferase-3
MKKFTPKNILVIKFRNIGDVLLTAPLISTLKMNLPQSRVCAAVKLGTEEMLHGHPHLDKLYVLPKRNKKEKKIKFLFRYINWLLELRRENFDLAINTTEGDRGIILSLLVGAKEKWSELKNPEKRRWRAWVLTKIIPPGTKKTHTVLRNLRLAAPLTKTPHFCVYLNVNQKDLNIVTNMLQNACWSPSSPLLHIHPTSRWFFKCWPDKSTAKVIDRLIDYGIQVVLTCGPDIKERSRIENIVQLCHRNPINLGGKLTLTQTAAVSKIADHFFGVDSAPMHMAAAMGTSVTAIFGPSGAYDWGPWPNQWEQNINPYPLKNGAQLAGSHQVIQKTWGCVPCGQDGCEGNKKSACLDTLDTDFVFHQIINKMSR